MATETVQTTQTKQPGKQEFKEEIKTEGPDGTQYETRYEYKVESKPEPTVADPYARTAKAQVIVHRNTLWALGAGLVPIPIVDVVAVTGIAVKMLKELSDLYGVGFRSSAVKKIVYSLLSGLGSVAVGSAIGFSLSKLLPGAGTAAGAISVPIFAGASTYAIGKLFIMHFELGGTFLDFDPHAMRAQFRQEYERAREKVVRMQKEEVNVSNVRAT